MCQNKYLKTNLWFKHHADCHNVAFIIDITAIIWQQILYHIVVFIFVVKFGGEYIGDGKNVNSKLCFLIFCCCVGINT